MLGMEAKFFSWKYPEDCLPLMCIYMALSRLSAFKKAGEDMKLGRKSGARR